MTVYLHAGLEKTGSSAIQTACFSNQEVLAQAGLSYWDISARHNWALSRLVGRLDFDASAKGRRSASNEDILENLRTALRDRTNLVLSAEGVAHFSRPDMRTLRELIGAATVIVYIREPRAWFTSKVQQRMKKGVPYEEALAKVGDFAQVSVTRLREAFGEVRLRLYRSNGLLADFLAALDCDPNLASQMSENRMNVTLSAAAMEALGAYFREHRRPPQSRVLRDLAELGGPPFRLRPHDLDELVKLHTADIAWASAELGVDLLALPPPSPFVPPAEADRAQTTRILAKASRKLAKKSRRAAERD